MAPRLDLQDKLVEILDSDHVYYQPPPNVQMRYPCIVYKREFIDTKWSNNKPYSLEDRYLVTVIDPDPDSEIPHKIASLPKCVFDRFYTANNLNHNVFKLFF